MCSGQQKWVSRYNVLFEGKLPDCEHLQDALSHFPLRQIISWKYLTVLTAVTGESEHNIVCRKDKAAGRRRNAETAALRTYNIEHGLPMESSSLPHSTISKIIARIGTRVPRWFDYDRYCKGNQGIGCFRELNVKDIHKTVRYSESAAIMPLYNEICSSYKSRIPNTGYERYEKRVPAYPGREEMPSPNHQFF